MNVLARVWSTALAQSGPSAMSGYELPSACDLAAVGASADLYDFVIHRTCTEIFDPLKPLYFFTFQTFQFSKR
jgi:hypothetical protein